jgi:hypothetical protein
MDKIVVQTEDFDLTSEVNLVAIIMLGLELLLAFVGTVSDCTLNQSGV